MKIQKSGDFLPGKCLNILPRKKVHKQWGLPVSSWCFFCKASHCYTLYKLVFLSEQDCQSVRKLTFFGQKIALSRIDECSFSIKFVSFYFWIKAQYNN